MSKDRRYRAHLFGAGAGLHQCEIEFDHVLRNDTVYGHRPLARPFDRCVRSPSLLIWA